MIDIAYIDKCKIESSIIMQDIRFAHHLFSFKQTFSMIYGKTYSALPEHNKW